jgi:hypothetical protein
MLPWSLSCFCFLFSIHFFWEDLKGFADGSFGWKRQRRNLQQVVYSLREIEETLWVGLVPSIERWQSLERLIPPWGPLASESLKELRSCGGALLPTLKRLRSMAEEHMTILEDAKAKSSQAFAQCIACSFLVPLLGGVLYFFMPAIEQNSRAWLIACTLALMMAALGSLWLFQLAESARWGGLQRNRRSWVLSSECAGERFLALVRSGTPPDLAWSKSCGILLQDSSDLAAAWGPSIWKDAEFQAKEKPEQIIVEAGASIKKAAQISLMEGRPCTDRVEAALLTLRQTMKAQIDKEMSLLSTRGLKPLFICVAPGLISLLAYGLWIAFQSSIEGGIDAF